MGDLSMLSFAKKTARKAWEHKFLILIVAIVTLVVGLVLYWAIRADLAPEWTGFGPYNEQADGSRSKTLWEWMELLIIPVVLAIGAWWINRSENENDRSSSRAPSGSPRDRR